MLEILSETLCTFSIDDLPTYIVFPIIPHDSRFTRRASGENSLLTIAEKSSATNAPIPTEKPGETTDLSSSAQSL